MLPKVFLFFFETCTSTRIAEENQILFATFEVPFTIVGSDELQCIILLIRYYRLGFILIKRFFSYFQLVWIECPTNPLLKIVDIKAICTAVKAINEETLILVDNTFLTSYFQVSCIEFMRRTSHFMLLYW